MKSLLSAAALSGLLLAPFPAAAASTVAVSDAWARATPNGAQTAAAYLTVTNRGAAPDRLLGGDSPAARTVQVHEMSMANGVMHMGEVKGGALIAPGASLKLQPGGWHLMLIGLKAPLRAGAMVAITLRFERAGEVKLVLPVRDPPAMSMHH
jgi:copper(I)-binding protein